jgi:hypothetical protein
MFTLTLSNAATVLSMVKVITGAPDGLNEGDLQRTVSFWIVQFNRPLVGGIRSQFK